MAAFNPETGENEPRQVLDTFTHHDIPTYRVALDNDQAVTTTAEHPFMVDGQGWTPVRELRKGDQLVRPDGSTVTIHSIDATGEVATVHNFEVDGLHNLLRPSRQPPAPRPQQLRPGTGIGSSTTCSPTR